MLAAALVVLSMVPAGPAPRIDVPSPTIVQIGTTSHVDVTGQYLDGVSQAVTSPPGGVTCKVTSTSPGKVRLRVRVASEAPVGERELRLVTPDGVSNGVAFHVGTMRVIRVAIDPPEGDPQRLPLPSVISGAILSKGRTDRLRFSAEKGRALAFDVHAVRAGSMLEPAVTVEDGKGRTLAWERPRVDGDAALLFVPPADGDYDLVIRDLRYRGGQGFHYRIFADAGVGEAAPSVSGSLEVEPNDDRGTAHIVGVPAVVKGCIDRPGDADTFRFQVDRKRTLVLDVAARSIGSPADALLLVHAKDGKRIAVSDDANGRDPRIRRVFDPGTYTATVKELVGAGGSAFVYRFSISPPTAPAPSFQVRFLPDAPRVGRGSHRKLWCQATRTGGFKGDVVLTFSGLPAGVTASPVRLGPGNGWTSVFTLGATVDAPLGSTALSLTATGSIAGREVTRACVPEVGGSAQRQAYVTVLDRPSVTVQPLEPPSAEQRRAYAAQLDALKAQLGARSQEVERERIAWEKEVRAAKADWTTLLPASLQAAEGSKLSVLRDGSILATGDGIQRDTYTIVANSKLEGISALRIELMPDDALPKRGPGRNPPSGNFVLSELRLTVAPAERPKQATVVKLKNPAARFSQNGFDIARAVDGNPATGWAVHPQEGRANWAVFDLESVVGQKSGTQLTVTIDQNHGGAHLLGRFRLSVAKARLSGGQRALPERVVEIVHAGQRSPAEERELDAWFRAHRSKHLASLRTRIEQLESGYGGGIEIDRLTKILETQTPELTASQREWERSRSATLLRWTPAPFTLLKSEQGVRFEKRPNDIARVSKAIGNRDTYTVEVRTDVRKITGIRLEALADKTLPAGGPGLAGNGNFVLSRVRLFAWPRSDPSAVKSVELRRPQASFEQSGWPVAKTLDEDANTGWAVMGNTGKDNHAVWQLAVPVDHAGGTALRFVLEQESVHVQHLLGRFRVSVTDAPNPGVGDRSVPMDVIRILARPGQARSPKDAQRLASFYRTIAKELDPVRRRLAVVRAQQAPYPPKVARGKRTRVAVRVNRSEGFAGEVRVSLEGFSSGRDGKRNPKPLTANVKTAPKKVLPNEEVALIDLQPTNKCELGTRLVVIRVEAKIGKDTVVEYSAPIPLTVTR